MIKTIVTRSALAVITLLAPIAVGWIVSLLNAQPVGFVLFAIYPQVFLFFPAGYMQSTTMVALLSTVYWILVFSISCVLVKKRLMLFWITFLLISIGSVWSVHMILGVVGFDLHIDSL